MTVPNPKPRIQDKRLSPPQFGIRTLMLLVAVCGGLLALLQWLPPIAVLGIALFGISIFLHVAGNCLGTRLRAIGDEPGTRSLKDQPRKFVRPEPHNFAPATHLGQRRSLGWIVVIATFVGIIAGGVGGGFWTLVSSRGPAELSSIAVGAIAFATLGGIASFAVVGFTQVLLTAILQAMKPPLPHAPPHRVPTEN
jgi:hypothetical protein